ncbi:MAG: sugar phosphate isomerase/epimerase [Burkholderiales bacterium]|nr:sugar phosphate isomerase/epimerase [Burkholderiales bacterium]
MTRNTWRLALHTWTIDTTPLAEALTAIRDAGWDSAELRYVDFERSRERGMDNAAILRLIQASGVKVDVLGTEYGLIFAEGAERDRLLASLELTCSNAVALGCPMVMIAPGQNTGTPQTAAANLRLAGQTAAKHGLRFALEFNSQHPVLNSLQIARAILAEANHPACGLLLDTYHLQRSSAGGRGFAEVPAKDIFTFQFSDVPDTPPTARRPTDRLCPGKGLVRWAEVFALLEEKGYRGCLSYEAPNPVHWERPPLETASEGLEATRALLRR